MKRIPVQSVKGKTDLATESLKMLFSLNEVERQATIFGASFKDAMEAAQRDDADGCWRHMQSALFAGIVVNRLIRRHSDLARMLNLPNDEKDTPLLHLYRVRNALEHIDQRADVAIKSPNISSVSDWYLADTHIVVSSDDVPAGGRAFSPSLGVLFYDREPLDMFMLDLDMVRLLHNCREAQHELLATLPGRSHFGGGQLVKLASDSGRLGRWVQDRTRLSSELAGPVPFDGRVRMWMQLDSSDG
jgi:hypothetical protein